MTHHVRKSYRNHRKATRGLALLVGVTVAAAVVLVGVVGSGSAASQKKTLNCTTVDPNPVAATGSSVSFTLRLCNDLTSPNQLGSASITPPAGFSITSVTLPAGASWNSTTNVLTNLAIAPGSTKDISILATTPSLCADPGNLYWSIYAKQSNDFNGQPGNNFFPYPFQLPQHVSASCTLTFFNQPGETAGTTAVRTTKWGAIRGNGDPIKVKVVSGGSDVTSATGTVSIKATGCSMGGTTSASFSGGVATFSNLTMANVTSVTTGCTLQAYNSSAGYADSSASGSFKVDPANLYFVTQPASAVVNTVLTDNVNGGTVIPPDGNPIEVGVQTTDESSSQQFNGAGSVSMAISGTDPVTHVNCSMSSTSVSLDANSGVASFSALMPTSIANGCTLIASTTSGYNSATSAPFNVAQSGCDGPCTITTQGAGGTQLTTTAAGGFDFVIVNSNPSIDPSVTGHGGGCANFVGTGTGFDVTDGRNADGTLDLTLYIADKALKMAYGTNYGQPNVPICVGAKVLINNSPVNCTSTDPLNQPFADRTLGTNGKFNGGYDVAKCGDGGYWWGVIGTFQDPNPPFHSTAIPLIVGWGSDGGYRTFNIHVPSGWDFTPKG